VEAHRVVEIARIVRPQNLREALGVAFVHRDRTRWRAGASRLLGLSYAADADDGSFVVDVADIPDFREVRLEGETVRIGAFADPDRARAEPRVQQSLGTKAFSPDVARFRLGALGARLVVAGIGATRTAAFADVLGAEPTRPLSSSEIPLAVELQGRGPHVWFGDRSLKRRDGQASFDLRVYAALTLAGHHRIAVATIAYTLDGAHPAGLPEVDATLRNAHIGRNTFADAARHAADVFHGEDVRSNTLRRTIIPLVLSTLKEAYAEARAQRP
jgi:CO/xanthine dehydrogenase FAD-binding subunit